MAPKRDWLDYANTAANAIQTIELGNISGAMSRVAELEVQKRRREDQAALEERCEDQLRNAVFTFSEQLRDTEEIAESRPAAAYLRATHLRRLYDNPRFTPNGFRKFEDKERMANAKRLCDRIIRETSHQLQPGERETCEACVAHLSNRQALIQLISVQESVEKLPAERAELTVDIKELAAKRLQIVQERAALMNSVKTKVGSGVLVLVLWLGGGALILGNIGQTTPKVDEPIDLFGLVGFAGIAGGIGLLIWGAVDAVSGQPLDERTQCIDAKLTALRQEISKREREDQEYGPLYKKFGVASAENYRRMLQERDSKVEQIITPVELGIESTPAPLDVPPIVPVSAGVSPGPDQSRDIIVSKNGINSGPFTLEEVSVGYYRGVFDAGDLCYLSGRQVRCTVAELLKPATQNG